MKLNIISGLVQRPIKVSIYGVEGIGKSTIGSQFPNPLIIDTENGTSRINCNRVKCTSWNEILEIVREIVKNPSICKTLVIDTFDKAETYCVDYICEKNHKPNIESFPYGSGYNILQSEMELLFRMLNQVIESENNVVLIAHAKAKKFELPEETGSYDRYETKLTRQVAPLFKEWCDILLFCNYKTYVITTENNTKKAQGGKRVMYTTHHACWDAKNRFDLPDELELSFKPIAHLFLEEKKSKIESEIITKPIESDVVLKLKELINESKVTEELVEEIVINRGKYPNGSKISDYSDEFITKWVFPNWMKIVEVIKKNNLDKGEN